ncbi:MAG: hypothetical protein KAV82_01105 [Phycisphaerae bacterium]|nr:hypothetical protein [Phycisphaerae bacterium]
MRHTSLVIGLVFAGFAAHLSQAADPLMYVNDSANRLLTVDVSTGHVERLGNTNAQFTVDTETGSGTTVGTLSGYRSAGDLTADAQGRLLLTTDAGMLVEVDRDVGGALPIGSLPYTDIFAFATTAEGTLYGVRSTNEIVTVDADTGQATITETLEGDFLLARAWGASFPSQHVPEPATLIFALFSAVLLIARRWEM